MKVEIQIDEKFNDEIIIKASKVSDELKEIINSINKIINSKKIYGKLKEKIYILDVDKVNNIIVDDKKIKAILIDNTEFILDYKLYELENYLDLRFIRISKSEIINIRYIDYLVFENNGLTKIKFKNGKYTYSSRLYLKNLKERLKI